MKAHAIGGLLILFVCLGMRAQAIEVSGSIDSNTTWDDTTAPYVIDNLVGPIEVSSGVTLTIGPGVTVSNKYSNKSSIVIDGTLNAGGAEFAFETHVGGGLTPIIVHDGGVAEFANSTLNADHTLAQIDPNSVLILTEGSAILTLADTIVRTGASGTAVNVAVLAPDDVTLTVTGGSFSGFPMAIAATSSTGLSVTAAEFADCLVGISYVQANGTNIPLGIDGADFLRCERGLSVDAPGADLTIANAAFMDCGLRSIEVLAVDDLVISDTTIADSETGVFTEAFNTFSVAATISQQQVGIRFALDKRGTDVASVTFENNATDVLVEGEIDLGTISSDTTLEPGRYILTNTLGVAADVTLTIPEGVILAGKHGDRYLMDVSGTVVANGARFEPLMRGDNVGGMIFRGSARGTFTGCTVWASSYQGADTSHGSNRRGSIWVIDDGQVDVVGSTLLGSPEPHGFVPGYGIRVQDQGQVRIQADGTTRSSITGFKIGVWADTPADLNIDSCDFVTAEQGMYYTSTGNLFLTHSTFTDCPIGINTDGLGVAVTDDVILDNCHQGLKLPWEVLGQASVNVAGVTFTNGSHCSLPVGGTIAKSLNMPVFPYLFRTGGSFVTIAEGVSVTFATGSSVLLEHGGSYHYQLFKVLGELNAIGTHFDFITLVSNHSWDGSRSIHFSDNGSGNFSNCTLTASEIDRSDNGCEILYLSENSSVTLAGCDLETTTKHGFPVRHGVFVGPTASLTVRDHNGVPSTFSGFDKGVYASSFGSLPDISLSTVYADCNFTCYLQSGFTLTENVDVPQSRYDIQCNNGPVVVPEGLSVNFPAGTEVNIVGDSAFDFMDIHGELRATGTTFQLRTRRSDNGWNGSYSFEFFGDAIGTFSDCVFTGYENYRQEHAARYFQIKGNADVSLAGCRLETGADGPFRVAYAIVVGEDASLDLEARQGTPTSFSGFLTALHFSGLENIGDVSGAAFADNDLDGVVMGGKTLSRAVTLPPAAAIQFDASTGKTHIAPSGTLTIPPGCRISNRWDYTSVFTIEGALIANDATFSFSTEYNGNNWSGSETFTLQSSGRATFTRCAILALDENRDEYYFEGIGARIFHLFEQSSLTLNGTKMEGTGATYYRVPRAIWAENNSQVTIAADGDIPSVISEFALGVTVWSQGVNLTIHDSIITRNEYGIRIDAVPATHSISGNLFLGNGIYSVQNITAGELDCRNNAWGHPSGPTHRTNPFGLGDPVSDGVRFEPFDTSIEVLTPELRDHPLGQVPNAFVGTGVSDALLARFEIDAPEPVTGLTLFLRLADVVGIASADAANWRLVRDEDGDGAWTDGVDALIANADAGSVEGRYFRFNAPFAIPGHFLILGDVDNLEGGDGFTLTLTAADLHLDAGEFAVGTTAPATHFLDRLFVNEHPIGQVNNQFRASPEQQDVTLLRFALTDGYSISKLKVSLSAISGIVAEDIFNVRLLVDLDRDGEADFGEPIVAAESISVSGANGTLVFSFGGNPIASNSGFVVIADFRKLHRDDTLTLAMPASGVTTVQPNVAIGGAANPARHTVATPIMLLDTAFPPSNGFVVAEQLSDLRLLGATIVPSGRQVTALAFELWDIEGITADDISNARLMLDGNRNGRIDDFETRILDTGEVEIDSDSATGWIRFDGGFTVPGGDLLLLADVANLGEDDSLTIGLASDHAEVAANDVIEGGISPIQHTVFRAELPEAALQTNWTLTYRSPGGTSATGAYSHDGSKLIVGYSSGTAFLYDSFRNAPGLMLHKHFDKVVYADFSVDDSLAITITRDGAVYLWDAATGELVRNLFADLLVRYAVPSPDVSKLFIVTEGKGMLLDLDTGATLWEFVIGDSTGSQLYAADYSPDGSQILVGAEDKRAYLLNAETGQIIRFFQGHSQAVTGATFAANGALIMTSSTDSTVTLWDATDSVNPITTVTLNDQTALGAAVNRNGTRVAILTNQGSTRRLRMFDDTGLELWNEVLPHAHFTGALSSVRFSPDSERLLICSNANADWNAPAALAVQYNARGLGFIDHVGPRGRLRGWHPDQFYQRVRVSEDGNRIFYMHTNGMDVVHTTPDRSILPFPDVAWPEDFDVTPDGRKLVRVQDSVLRFWSVNENRFTLLGSNNIGANHAPLTLSRNGGLTIHGDRLLYSLTGIEFANSPNPEAGYRSAFSPDESLWGIAFYNDMSIKTILKDDASGSLEFGVTLTAPYRPRDIIYHPDGIRVGCVDEYAGVQFYRLDDNEPVGLYDHRGATSVRVYDAALSRDGTMLAVARGNSVRLYDMRTGRVMRYFYPTHSGQADCLAISVGFGARDNMLYIGWSDSYVEIFQRSKVRSLRINPVTRTLPIGDAQHYSVKAIYDDGSSVDVTPSYVFRAAGAELAPGARLYADPPEAVTIEADRVTVNPGADGDIRITAIYTEGGFTRSAEAILSVGDSPLQTLVASPDVVTLSPGVVMPIRYTAVFSDAYEADVTAETTLASDAPDRVRIVGNNVSVQAGTVGDIIITGSYTHKGILRTAETVISVHGPSSRWARTVVTPGGDTTTMAYSPDGTRFAVGSMSGAVSLYDVGLTPTQYDVDSVILAHSRPVRHLYFRSNTQLVTVGDDGAIRQWDLGDTAEPIAEFASDAVLTAAAFLGRYGAVGDNVGRVMLFDLDQNAPVWQRGHHSGQVNSVAIENSRILTGGEDRYVYLLDRSFGDIQMTYTAFAKAPVSVGFEGSRMFVLSADKRLAKWDIGSEDDNLAEFFFPAQPTALTMAGDRTYVATNSNGVSAIWIYDANGLLLRWLEVLPNEGLVSSLAVTPGRTHVITGRSTTLVEEEDEFGTKERLSEFHSCQFWDLNRGSYSGSLVHSRSLNAARMTRDGSLLFTQSARRVFRWDIGQTQARSSDSISGSKYLETGYFAPFNFSGLELSGDAAGLMGTRVGQSIFLMRAQERLLHMSVHTDASAFAISPDGTRLITNTAGPLTRFWDIDLDFPTVVHENPVVSYDVAFVDNSDSLGSVSGDMFVSIFNEAGLRYSGIIVQPVSGPVPGTGPGETVSGPLLENLTASANGHRVALVLRYLKEDAFGGMTSFVFVQVYDIRDRQAIGLLFEEYLGAIEGEPPVAVALSDDGVLFFCGIGAAEQDGLLFDINTGRTLNRFASPSAGTRSNLGVAGADFSQGDAALMIAWREGIAEIFHRQGVDALRVSPAARSVTPGGSLELTAFADYADGTSLEVTGKVTISVDPEAAATVSGNTITIADGVQADDVIVVTLSYTELGVTRSGQAVLTVQSPRFVELSVDPPKLSLTRGDSVTLRFFAHDVGGSVTEVTNDPDLAISAQPPDLVVLTGSTVTILDQAQYGDVAISARITRDGDEREATAYVHIRNPGSMINPGDFDESLTVDFGDLIYFLGHYGENDGAATWDSRADFDESGVIDYPDAAEFVGLYGSSYTPARSGVGRSASAVQIWLELPVTSLSPGDIFEVDIYVQEDDPEANGFRGGPIDLIFDPTRVRHVGELLPAAAMQPPYNSLPAFLTGELSTDRIAGLGGLTVASGFGDGTPVHYAHLSFEALAEGEAMFQVLPCATSGLVLTPPRGRLTLGDTDYGAPDAVVIDLGGDLPVDMRYDICAGWNLIGIPLIFTAARQVPLPEDLQFYAWESGGYTRVNSLIPGRGYWVFSPRDRSFVVTGFPLASQPPDLSPGWNLIAPAISLGVSGHAWSWDAERQLFRHQREALQPGRAYWVHSE